MVLVLCLLGVSALSFSLCLTLLGRKVTGGGPDDEPLRLEKNGTVGFTATRATATHRVCRDTDLSDAA